MFATLWKMPHCDRFVKRGDGVLCRLSETPLNYAMFPASPFAIVLPRFNTKRTNVPKYAIEREIPGAGKLSAADLQGIAAKSRGVLQTLGPSIQWVHSYVTDDKLYCVYIAPNEALVREHAKRGGFPRKQDFRSSRDNRPDHCGVVSRRTPQGMAIRPPPVQCLQF